MKVCQLCAVDFTLKHFLLPLIDGMRARGWAVTAVCSAGKHVAQLRTAGYEIETIAISRSLNPLLALRSLFALARLFRARQFDVVHAHTPVAALIGRLAARLAGTPLVVYTAHGFYFHDEMYRWKRAMFVALERLGGHFTDLLFSQSEEDAKSAVEEGIASADNVMVIGNGVVVGRFDPERVGNGSDTRDALGIPRDSFVVGMIGRQVREKGIGEFLSAATEIGARDSRYWFLLVGERLSTDHAAGVEGEFVRAKAALGPRLVATGLRKDIPELLAAMDLFCLPSWREGMPRTIIEAMMMGKPVLATDIRGAREEVVPEATGVLVPTRDAAALSRAMQRFADNPEWARRLGVAGRERALLLYDERKVVERQLDRIMHAARQRGLL